MVYLLAVLQISCAMLCLVGCSPKWLCLSIYGRTGSPVELMLPYFVQLMIVLTFSRYLEEVSHIKGSDADTYRYLNFDKLPEYVEKAEQVCALPSMQTFDISHAESPCRIGLVPHRAILARLSLLHHTSEKLVFFLTTRPKGVVTNPSQCLHLSVPAAP